MGHSSCLLARLLLLFMATVAVTSQLSADFYSQSCPNVEQLIRNSVQQKFQQAPTSAAATLRLFFHDCFVEGCDASVILASTPDNKAEKDADINLSLAGDAFDAVIRAKNVVEQACPGVVSCADVLAIATRDFVGLTGGPSWNVLMGRRDGRVSKASDVAANMPTAHFDVNQLLTNFAAKKLDLVDMVALSGAHTIGFSHCNEFTDRLYSFKGQAGRVDPTMNSSFVSILKPDCPQTGGNPNLVEPFDPRSPFGFDNSYYKNLLVRNGLITTDQVLQEDKRTRGIVKRFSKKQDKFFEAFAQAMIKMGNIDVKTGNEGEIRRDCARVNHVNSFHYEALTGIWFNGYHVLEDHKRCSHSVEHPSEPLRVRKENLVYPGFY